MEKIEIKYLVKFIQERQHAENLATKGELHCNIPKYYCYLFETTKNLGQADPWEASFLRVVHKNSHLPIYCMTAIFDSDSYSDIVETDNKKYICFQEKLIHTFCPHKPFYAVFFDFEPFFKIVKNDRSNGVQWAQGLVKYEDLSIKEQSSFLTDRTARNLFSKHTCFCYQKEFRVCAQKELDQTAIKTIGDHKEMVYEKDGKKYEGINYYLSELSSIAVLLSSDDFIYDPKLKAFLVPLSKLDK